MSGQEHSHQDVSASAARAVRDIERLQERLEGLVQRLDALQLENKTLLERQEASVAERAQLVQRSDQARTRVEAMIERLKALELAGLSP